MHTRKYNKTSFNFDGDLSGKVRIRKVSDIDNGNIDDYFEVDGEDLVNFVIDHLKDKIVSSIESMDSEEFLNKFLNVK